MSDQSNTPVPEPPDAEAQTRIGVDSWVAESEDRRLFERGVSGSVIAEEGVPGAGIDQPSVHFGVGDLLPRPGKHLDLTDVLAAELGNGTEDERIDSDHALFELLAAEPHQFAFCFELVEILAFEDDKFSRSS